MANEKLLRLYLARSKH